ncbi:MAG: hypothetical protein R6U96_19065 [Promethearchaeia archaeon]
MQEKTRYPDSFESTRHKSSHPEFDPSKPRLGRRESEPHSDEINYLYEVLATNFPQDRTMWDLHHYFTIDDIDIDIQFDISYFKDMHIPKRLSSYKAKNFDNRVPTMAINVLSKNTWHADIGEHVDYCRKLQIPLYIVFPSFHVATEYYKPPFLRVYILQSTGEYNIKELREVTIEEEKENLDAVLDISNQVPFRLGLKKRSIQHESGNPLYRLVLLDPTEFKVLPTKAQKAEKKATKLEARIKELEEQLKD